MHSPRSTEDIEGTTKRRDLPEFISFIGFVLSFAPIIYSYIQNNAAITDTSFIFSIFIILITDKIANYYIRAAEREARHTEFSYFSNAVADLDRKIGNSSACICLGSPDVALRYVLSRLPDTKMVWNTYIKHYPDGEEVHYSGNAVETTSKAISDFINTPGNKWVDIFSYGDDDFYQRIFKSVSSAPMGSYQCYRLKRSFPSINFIIMRHNTDRWSNDELIFGWGHHKHDPYGMTFLTKDRELIETLYRLFQSLREECEVFRPSDIKSKNSK